MSSRSRVSACRPVAWAGIVFVALACLPAAEAQVAPVMGTHYAARPSETGFAGAVNSMGGYGATVPLDLPAVRGDLPLPLAVVYGGREVGAAGASWDVPLSYIFRSASIAHRRPQPGLFSVVNPAPIFVPIEYVMMIGGERIDLVRNAADTAWVGRRGNAQLEVRAVNDAVMVMYDGEGRTYFFSSQGGSAGSRLAGGDLFVLVAISAIGNQVKLTYTIGAPVLPGGDVALSINLANIVYNQSPTSTSCFKNMIQLQYDTPAIPPQGSPPAPPLAMSMLNATVLARVNKLTSISVRSNASCNGPEQALRDYTFNYQSDLDTRRPQLQSVTMTGRQGTPERSITLPVAAFAYGSIVDPALNAITYQVIPNIGPPRVGGAHHYTFGVSYTSVEESPEPHDPDDVVIDLLTTQAFIDVNGDARPDFLSEVGFYPNVPGPDGTTAFAPRQAFPIDAREKTHSTIFNSSIYRNNDPTVNDTLRQLIDMNGDGRLDVVETVLPDIDHWIIHLNKPDPTDPRKSIFVDIKIPVARMRLALGSTGLSFGRVPLARNTTVPEQYAHCWKWVRGTNGFHWEREFIGLCNDTSLDSARRTRTITEFELKDVNGDGYPDFVYNASFVRTSDPLPASFVPPPPPDPQQEFPVQRVGRIIPSDMTGSRDVKVLINTAGVHLADQLHLFASPITLEVGGPQGCGIRRWEADPSSVTGGILNESCSLEDVNGDGIADRITSVVENGQIVANAALGTGVPEQPYSHAVIVLPGPLGRTEADLVLSQGKYRPRCIGSPSRLTVDLRRTRGLRDINGDGIPDYVSGQLQDRGAGVWSVAMGTGTGFAPPVSVNSPLGLELSREQSTCSGVGESGELASTPTGLYDIDGNGQPELVNLNLSDPTQPHWDVLQLKPAVDQVDVGPVAGVPASGRLTRIENGYGAVTRIGYKSAKEDTRGAHNLPFPEIVVTAVATTAASDAGAPLVSTTHHAYRGAGLIFDSAADAFVFRGYQRTVELRATSEQVPDGSVAIVTDTYGLAPFDPAMNVTARFQRYLQVGMVKDVTVVSGRLGTDPWVTATGDISTVPLRSSGTHYEWEVRLLTTGVTPAPISNGRCMDMMFPYDYATSVLHQGASWEDECTKRGFLFQKVVTAWRGRPEMADPFTSELTIKTGTAVKSVDDFGRVTEIAQLNDLARTDDDLCVRTTFATPAGTNERVLSAPASRTVTPDACTNPAAVPVISETYEYDTSSLGTRLPSGQVAAGLLSSRIVSRRRAATGEPLGDANGNSDIRMFDAAYDAATGMMASLTIAREDGAIRKVSKTYDAFAIAAVTVTTEATNADGTKPPVLEVTTTRDAQTLDPLFMTEPNGTKVGHTYDGFGRVLLSSVTPPGGTAGVLSSTTYLGFALGDTGGRRVVHKVFTDPVGASSVGTAAGRTSTTFLDSLGRETHAEVELGADYGNKILIVGRRAYDKLGRVVFEADPHPSTESALTAYGTSFFFSIDGTPTCSVRGRGPQAFTTVADETAERYPTCVNRFFATSKEIVDVGDAASLLPGSSQAGVFEETIYTAIGRPLRRSIVGTSAAGPSKLDDIEFTYDPLGHLATMTRKEIARQAAGSVTTTWEHDNLDQLIRLEEPDVAPQLRTYDRWGELVSTQWCDPTFSSCSADATNRRTDYRYDGLGRLVHSEDRTSNVVDPKSVRDFVYDQGQSTTTPPITATNVRGRLAKASALTSSVAYSYDAFGHVNAEVFSDLTTSAKRLYVQKYDYHADGSLQTLHLLLPDNAFKDERAEYSYDSAGRTRTITYDNGTPQSLLAPSGSDEMYDVFGRLRKVQYAATTYATNYADTGRRQLRDVTVTTPGGGGNRRISFQPVPGTAGSITAFDPVGRERVRTESHADNVQPVMMSNYDALGRLASTSARSNATTSPLRGFAYDSLGNLVTQTNLSASSKISSLSFHSTDRDRICSIAYGADTAPEGCNVSYDGVGNIVSQLDRNNSLRTFTYFPGGEIATIANGSATATFDYDAFGDVQRLVVEGSGAAETRHDKHFGDFIYERDELIAGVSTPVITRSVPGPGGMVATRHGPGTDNLWTFTFGELRGTRFVTDRDGAVSQDLSYTPYGEAVSNGAPPGSRKYQNQQWNGGDALAAFGLSQLGARIYDPVIGRFLSRDPLVLPATASSTNPYSFATNDPVNNADPSGLGSENDPTGTPPPCAPGVCGSSGPYGTPVKDRPDRTPSEPRMSTTTSANGQAQTSIHTRAGLRLKAGMWWFKGVSFSAPYNWDNLAEITMDLDDTFNYLGEGQGTYYPENYRNKTLEDLKFVALAIPYETLVTSVSKGVTALLSGVRIAEMEASFGASLSLAYKPGFPGHNKIGITVGGKTRWTDLIPSEEFNELSRNPLKQTLQLMFGRRPAWIRLSSNLGSNYQVVSMGISRAQAAAAMAQAQAIRAAPGMYNIVSNSCTSFARSVMAAAGRSAPWWARSPRLLFKSVKPRGRRRASWYRHRRRLLLRQADLMRRRREHGCQVSYRLRAFASNDRGDRATVS
jgi:RHS repeat-associated protein